MSQPAVTVEIGPQQASVRGGVLEVWRQRDLLRWFTWRDVKVRYKQTALGATWILLQPLGLMVVFTIFLGRFAGLDSADVPYALFVFSGLVVWTTFSQSAVSASGSVIASSSLVTKVYFPRYLVPLAASAARLVDGAIAMALLPVMLVLYGYPFRIELLAAPVLILAAWFLALGVGSTVAALSIRHRDAQQAIPFIMQLWLFATPVTYSVAEVPERWRWLYGLNPMVAPVEGLRWSVLGTDAPSASTIGSAVTATVGSVLLGFAVFHRAQLTLTDRL